MKIAKPFTYSTDGVTERRAVLGSDPSLIPADLVPGLVRAGYLEEELPLQHRTLAETGDSIDPPSATGAYAIRRGGQGKYLVVDPDGANASEPMLRPRPPN